ncbi:MAG: methyltransferase domain-containing protein [Myxococcota bacterium]
MTMREPRAVGRCRPLPSVERHLTILPNRDELTRKTFSLGGTDVSIWHLSEIDGFLGRLLPGGRPADDDVPYYAWVWPVSTVLGAAIMRGPALTGKTAIELGCGHGLAGLCAGLKGARVTLTDLQDGAIMLARMNVEELQLQDRVTVMKMDWRAPTLERADIIICSDVIYQHRFIPAIVNAIWALLKPKGVALIADASREYFPRFTEAAINRGFRVDEGPSERTEDGTVARLYALRHQDVRGTEKAPWES